MIPDSYAAGIWPALVGIWETSPPPADDIRIGGPLTGPVIALVRPSVIRTIPTDALSGSICFGGEFCCA
jgi:hypothetical protein